jgi:hypothetical protein
MFLVYMIRFSGQRAKAQLCRPDPNYRIRMFLLGEKYVFLIFNYLYVHCVRESLMFSVFENSICAGRILITEFVGYHVPASST